MNKIVVFQNGQQVISKVSVISREDTGERIGYLLTDPRVVIYYQEEEDIKVKLIPFVTAAINDSYEIRITDVLTFGDPHPSLEENYTNAIEQEKQSIERIRLEVEEETDLGTVE